MKPVILGVDAVCREHDLATDTAIGVVRLSGTVGSAAAVGAQLGGRVVILSDPTEASVLGPDGKLWLLAFECMRRELRPLSVNLGGAYDRPIAHLVSDEFVRHYLDELAEGKVELSRSVLRDGLHEEISFHSGAITVSAMFTRGAALEIGEFD